MGPVARACRTYRTRRHILERGSMDGLPPVRYVLAQDVFFSLRSDASQRDLTLAGKSDGREA